jgi:hypothetical protein
MGLVGDVHELEVVHNVHGRSSPPNIKLVNLLNNQCAFTSPAEAEEAV